MKIPAPLLAGLPSALPCSSGDCETGHAKSAGRAKAEGKFPLLDFSGSDWCGRTGCKVFGPFPHVAELQQYIDTCRTGLPASE